MGAGTARHHVNEAQRAATRNARREVPMSPLMVTNARPVTAGPCPRLLGEPWTMRT